jgi:hypothetical protein
LALPEAVPRALPPPASVVTAPSTQGKRDGEREALREREREGVAVGEGGMLMAKLYATESQRQFALGSKRSSIIKPAGTAAMAVEKTNGEAALGQLLTPESEDQSTVSLATSVMSKPSCDPQEDDVSQTLAVTCSAAYALSAVKRTAGMQKPNPAGPHELAVLGCVEPFPMWQ